MSRPATRVLALLEVLSNRGLVAAEELARRLEVDVRSVRRYATALREMGIPVESTRGPYGGYRLAPGYRPPPLMLRDDEAVAIAVALTTATRGSTANEPSPTDLALLKLNRVLPAALRQRVNTLTGATAVIGSRPPVATPDAEVTLTLAAAVRSGRRVRIEHARPEGHPTTRQVDPYGLVVHGRRWYLVGHDHLRDAVRTFRVDRIASVTELPDRFAPPAGFDPVGHVTHALAIGAWTHRTEVWLDTDVATARQRLPATAGELHPDPVGGVLMVSGVENLSAMAQLLAGLPWRFTIRQPRELIDAFAAHVATLAEAVTRATETGNAIP